MTEATANTNPDRPSTDTDYQPIAGFAIAALLVAGLLVFLMLFLGGNSFRKGKPLLYSWLLVVAALGFALSVIARIHIRRSEGTRSGMQIANVAWWITILIGGGYAAYLYASKLALAKQSKEYALEWFALLQNQSDANPSVRETDFYAAFLRTLEPTSRSTYSPADREQLELEFTPQLTSFRSSRVVTLLQRGGKEIQVIPKSMGNWEQTPTGYEVEQVFQLRSPEGEFDVLLHMLASEGKNHVGRQWRIVVREDPSPRAVTSYGYAIVGLEKDARKFGDDWLSRWTVHQWENTYLLTLPPDQRPFGEVVSNQALPNSLFVRPSHCVVGGVATFFRPAVTASDPPETDDDKRKANILATYRSAAVLGGSSVVPTLNQQILFAELQSRDFFHLIPDKDQGPASFFRYLWQTGAVVRIEELRMQSTEGPPVVSISPTEVRVTMPIFLAISLAERKISPAKLTVRSTDPNLLRELQALHDAGKANPNSQGTSDILNQLPARHWQIYSIESNLKLVKPPRQPNAPPPVGAP